MNEPAFDPEVVALLDEIARSPEGSLLRLPKRPLKQWVAAPEEMVSPRGSALTRAEKHLLDVYREEAAWVLLERCVIEMRSSMTIYSTCGGSPSDLSNRANRISQRVGEAADIENALRPLGSKSGVSPACLAISALTLRPSDFGRLCLALALISAGDDGTALAVLGSLTSNRTLASTRAQAFENLGLLSSRRRRFDSALEFDEQACRADESKVRLLVWCFLDALQGGNQRAVLRFMAKVEEREETSTLLRIATDLAEDREKGRWSPTSYAIEALPRLLERACDPMRSLLDAFR